MLFIAELVMYLVKFKIQIWIEWISTHRNCLADALSRHRIAEFRQRCDALGARYRSEPDFRWDGSEMMTNSTNYIIREVAIISKLAEKERWVARRKLQRPPSRMAFSIHGCCGTRTACRSMQDLLRMPFYLLHGFTATDEHDAIPEHAPAMIHNLLAECSRKS